MDKKHFDEQLVSSTGRWLGDVRHPKVRAECREQVEEWLADDDGDHEIVRTARRFWQRLLKESSR